MKYSNRSHGIVTLLAAAPLIYLGYFYGSPVTMFLHWSGFVMGVLGLVFPPDSNYSKMIPVGFSLMTMAFHYYVIAALFDGYLIFMGIEALAAIGLTTSILNKTDNQYLSISNVLNLVTLVVLSSYIPAIYVVWGALFSVLAFAEGVKSSEPTLSKTKYPSSSVRSSSIYNDSSPNVGCFNYMPIYTQSNSCAKRNAGNSHKKGGYLSEVFDYGGHAALDFGASCAGSFSLDKVFDYGGHSPF